MFNPLKWMGDLFRGFRPEEVRAIVDAPAAPGKGSKQRRRASASGHKRNVKRKSAHRARMRERGLKGGKLRV